MFKNKKRNFHHTITSKELSELSEELENGNQTLQLLS